MADGSIQGGVVSLTFDGEALGQDIAAAVTGATVEQRLNMPTACTIDIHPVDYDAESDRVMDLSGVDLGSTLTVQMGFGNPKPLFSGQVAALEPNLNATCRELQIIGYDYLYALAFGTKVQRFENVSDSAVARQIITAAGLTPEVEDTEAIYPYVLQNNVSDYRFLLSRAMRISFELFAQDRTIVFRSGRAGEEETLSLEYGVTLTRFRARMKALKQGGQVTRLGWDPQAKRAIVATVSSGPPSDRMGGTETGYQASSVFGSSATAAPNASITDTQIAQSLAAGAFQNDLDGFMEGVAECPGNPAITPGINVRLNNIGAKFSGPYYVVAARHSYDINGGYTTRFEVRRTGI